jgi:hypothetical protein
MGISQGRELTCSPTMTDMPTGGAADGVAALENAVLEREAPEAKGAIGDRGEDQFPGLRWPMRRGGGKEGIFIGEAKQGGAARRMAWGRDRTLRRAGGAGKNWRAVPSSGGHAASTESRGTSEAGRGGIWGCD